MQWKTEIQKKSSLSYEKNHLVDEKQRSLIKLIKSPIDCIQIHYCH